MSIANDVTSILVVLKYLVTRPRLVRKLLSASYKGYLLDVGWIASIKSKLPLNAKGEPLPWLTYPLIHLLDERLTKEMAVFEFGGGNSTLYFSRHVGSVTTVEHNPKWHEYLTSRVPANCLVLLQELEYDGAYCRVAESSGQRYDIVLVDGRDRVNCAHHAVTALKEGGVIIFDDFERERYQQAAAFLAEAGFRQLNLWGMKPGLMEGALTAVFYRPNNVLGI